MQESKCVVEWSPYRGIALYHENSTSYYAYRYNRNQPVAQSVDLTNHIKIGRCDVRTVDRLWRTEQVGPFTTFGGFDWTTTMYANLFNFQTVVGIKAFYGTPVDAATGAALSWPPLHVHHWEASPGNGRYYSNICTFGDGLCPAKEDGIAAPNETECLGSERTGKAARQHLAGRAPLRHHVGFQPQCFHKKYPRPNPLPLLTLRPHSTDRLCRLFAQPGNAGRHRAR